VEGHCGCDQPGIDFLTCSDVQRPERAFCPETPEQFGTCAKNGTTKNGQEHLRKIPFFNRRKNPSGDVHLCRLRNLVMHHIVRFAKRQAKPRDRRLRALHVLEAATNALTLSVGHTRRLRLRKSLEGLLAVLHTLRV
jgi:hypothetical protein